jgi:hypothetical protein
MKTANVTAFVDSIGAINQVPIVHGALAYDCPYSGKCYILIVHHGLHFPEMEHNLIPPFQMRVNDLIIDECPKFLSTEPSDKLHSIFFPSDNVRLPLSLIGTTSFLHTRKPTTYEYDNEEHLILTNESPEWNPHSVDYAAQEENMVDDYGMTRENRQQENRTICNLTSISVVQEALVQRQSSQSSSVLNEISNTLNDTFVESMKRHVNISSARLEPTNSLVAATNTIPKHVVGPERLSKTWNIGIEAAKRTCDSTTQKGVRSVLNPSISKRYWTNDRQLRYRRLNTTLYTDTMFATVTSKRGNNCGQIWVNDLEWTRLHP